MPKGGAPSGWLKGARAGGRTGRLRCLGGDLYQRPTEAITGVVQDSPFSFFSLVFRLYRGDRRAD